MRAGSVSVWCDHDGHISVQELGRLDNVGAQESATREPARPGRSRHRQDMDVQESGVQESGARPPRQRKMDVQESASRPPRHQNMGVQDSGEVPPAETYRIEVGHLHGVKPNNIVGAIANEVGLEGRFIGRVVIREDHSFVDLPGGMPKEVFRQLQKVRVAGQPLQISRALKTHVEKLRRERPPTAKFKGKPQRGAQRGRRK